MTTEASRAPDTAAPETVSRPSKGVGRAWLPLLVVALLFAWKVGPRNYYAGGDGKFCQEVLRGYFEYTQPFQVHALNPLQGNFTELLPLNAWINPALIQFFLLPFETARSTSMLTFLLLHALAVYALARRLGMDRVSAGIAAQCTAWLFPPFSFFDGVLTVYVLLPPVSLTVSLFLLLLSLTLGIGPEAPARQIVGRGVAAGALLAFAIFNDPMMFGLVAFSIAPTFLVALIVVRGSRAAFARRIAALAVALVLLLAAGVVHYVLALDIYTYRYFFRAEFARAQLPQLASMALQTRMGALTFFALAAALALGSTRRARPYRHVVLIGWTALLVPTAAALVYLFVEFKWWPPLPMYMQFYNLSLAGIGAVAGVCAWFSDPDRRPLRAACLLVVPLALVVAARRSPDVEGERYPDIAMINRTLAPDLAVRAGGQWRGSVYIAVNDYRQHLTMLSLWNRRIPTQEVYGQTETPLWRYMSSKVMLGRGGYADRPDWNMGLLAALGIKYVMLAAPAGEASALAAAPAQADAIAARCLKHFGASAQLPLHAIEKGETIGYTDPTWFIYRVPEPNAGQYSPTEVALAGTVLETQKLFLRPDFDWRRNVVLEASPGPLTPAAAARLHVERGHLRVEATSGPGRSLLLLPVQYSHGLKLSGAPGASLVRANLYFAGLLFSGTVNAGIRPGFHVFGPRDRWDDIADLKRLKVGEVIQPSGAECHPYAIHGPGDVGPRLAQLAEVVRKLR